MCDDRGFMLFTIQLQIASSFVNLIDLFWVSSWFFRDFRLFFGTDMFCTSQNGLRDTDTQTHSTVCFTLVGDRFTVTSPHHLVVSESPPHEDRSNGRSVRDSSHSLRHTRFLNTHSITESKRSCKLSLAVSRTERRAGDPRGYDQVVPQLGPRKDHCTEADIELKEDSRRLSPYSSHLFSVRDLTNK